MTYGPAYSDRLDGRRIKLQHEVIRDWCLRHGWQTLAELSRSLNYPEASISAQLRHLRKERFGRYNVEKRRRGDTGTWEYLVRPPRQQTSLFGEVE